MYQDKDGYYIEQDENLGQRAAIYVAKVMGWMGMGLFTTFVSTLLCLSSHTVMSFIFSGRVAIYGIIGAQLALVFALGFLVNKLTPAMATVMFMLYAALTGVTMTIITAAFTLNSIALVFVETSAIFAALSIYGMVTKRDLTKIGTLAIFGLIGIIIASIVNIFLQSGMVSLIVNCVGILIFIILTAYDTQKIKNIYLDAAMAGLDEESPELRKLAIVGALTLYLDFINLFIKLLSILGKRK